MDKLHKYYKNDFAQYTEDLSESTRDSKDEYQEHLDAIVAIQSHNRDLLRKKIAKSISKQPQRAKIKTLRHRNWIMSIAASICLIAAALFLLNPSAPAYNLDQGISSILSIEQDKISRAGFAKVGEQEVLAEILEAYKNLNRDELNKLINEKKEVLSGEYLEKSALILQLKELNSISAEGQSTSVKAKFDSNQELTNIIQNLALLNKKSGSKDALQFFQELSDNSNSEYQIIAKALLN